MQALAAQVEKAVFKAKRFVALFFFGHLEGDDFGFAEHFHLVSHDLNFTGGELGVDGFGDTVNDFSGETDGGFNAPVFDAFVKRFGRIDNDLSQAVVVAQIDENDAAVVAYAMDPAGNFYSFANVFFAQLAAGVCSVSVHGVTP